MLHLSRMGLALGFCGILSAANFLPLESGNHWTYREPKSGQRFTVAVGDGVSANDQIYYRLTGYVNKPVLVRLDDSGQLVYLDDSGSERVLTPFVPSDDWQDAPLRICDQQAQAQDRRVSVDTPAGHFDSVLEVRYRTSTCADAGLESEQFAENIGMLRRTEQSFAGPRTYELVAARVGSLSIQAQPHASFTISVDTTTPQSPVVAMALRADALQLTFPSGQEYDIVLRDSTGKSVYRWSFGRLFIQSVHTRTVTGEWTENIPLLLPDPPSGTYTAQMWLTTAGEVPAFSATAPVQF